MSSKESKPSSAGSNQPDWFIVEGDDRTVGTRIDQRRAARDAGGLRLRGFTEAQRHKRELISFAEMADWYRNATGRENAIELLRRSIEYGDFEADGESRVLHLHEGLLDAEVDPSDPKLPKLTRDILQNATEIFPPDTVWRQYLSKCWVSRADAKWWFADEASPLETNKRTAGDDLHPAAASSSIPKFYTRKEAATYLRERGHMVGHKTLANWASEKKGPAFKILSGKAIYERSDLDDWLRSAPSPAGDSRE